MFKAEKAGLVEAVSVSEVKPACKFESNSGKTT